ncbi:hypothetical protein WMY93_018439 [Mugilogobius chulae]|uniref:Olfactory receptor n=1 Tax=Mugilogobius chulae TaxID=88201 RepID=A0AAW0NIV6_9GOBI
MIVLKLNLGKSRSGRGQVEGETLEPQISSSLNVSVCFVVVEVSGKASPEIRIKQQNRRRGNSRTRKQAMLNSSSFFVLAAYMDLGALKYLLFVFLLLTYVCILTWNLLLLSVICLNRTLRAEPMYVFLCSLLLNELYGSTALFPFLLAQILRDVHVVSAPACFLQIFALYSYGAVEFSMLAVMAYDRYLAVCRPLQYGSSMTPAKTAALTALTWGYSALMNLVVTYGLTFPLRLCANVIPKVYCDNFFVVRLSCSDTKLNNAFGLTNVFLRLVLLVALILYSYGRILCVCLGGSVQARRRALGTCTPHVLTLVNFMCGALFEVVQSRLDMSALPNVIRVFLSLYWLSLQPLASPLLYGLKLTKIRLELRKLLQRQALTR